MFATALLHCALSLVAAVAPPVQGGAAQDDFTSKSASGITVRYDKSIEIATADLDALLASLRVSREIARAGLGITLPFDPVVTVRRRKQPKGAYYTDGDDKIFFDFPNENFVTRLQLGDERIVRYALPCYLQIWLYRSLTSTGGLDPRILESINGYAMYLFKKEIERTTPGAKAPEIPEGGGNCWLQLETFYPGTTSFILNNISSMKVPAHLLGQTLREVAVAATDDPKIADLFDLITPPEPLLGAAELEPSPPLVAASALRTGRLGLFNGVPLLDAAGEPLPAGERMNEFEKLFLMSITIAPDNRIRREPPALRDLDIWRLYFEYRPRVLRARDNFDYYLVLREFFGRFQDRAMGLMPSPALPVPPGTPYWSSITGLKFARIGDQIYVARVSPGSEPEKAGVKQGLEVVTVDGRPAVRVVELLAAFARQFDSCPSYQRSAIFALDGLLTGAQGSVCKLELRDPAAPPQKNAKGELAPAPLLALELVRGLPPDQKAPPPTVEFTARPDQIGVMKIHQFGGDSLQRFAQAIEEANQAGLKGIVIDLRGNEGMSLIDTRQRTSSAMLGRLLPVNSEKLVIGSAVRRSPEEFDKKISNEIVIERTPGANPFTGRLAVVVDGWTGGESEWFVLGFQLAKLGLVVGQTTAGSVTAPKTFEAKHQSLTASRVDISFPSASVFWPDGSPLQTVGIKPQVALEPEVADLAAGRDTLIEKAAALLLQSP